MQQQQLEDAEQKLPDGWQRLFDSKRNRNYYFNKTTQESSWKRPNSSGKKAGGEVWKSAFSKEYNRAYYYNRSTGETRWLNPQQNNAEMETEMNSAVELIAALQLAKEKLQSDLQACETAKLELEKRVAQLEGEVGALKSNELDLQHEVKELRTTEAELKSKLESSQASLVVEERAPTPLPSQSQPQQKQQLVEPPPNVAVKFAVYDRNKDYRGCITEEGDCFDNRHEIRGYLNFISLEAGSKDEDFLGGLYENKFDNVCQVRNEDDEMVAYLDMGTRSVRGLLGNTIVDFEADGIIKHTNGTYLGEFRGAKGFHDMRELTLYLVLLDGEMCNDV